MYYYDYFCELLDYNAMKTLENSLSFFFYLNT